MKNIKLKGMVFFILLFLLVGIASASEDNMTDTLNIPDETQSEVELSNDEAIEPLSVDDNVNEPLAVENEDTLKDVNYNDIVVSDDPCEYPVITVKSISGYQGKTLTLKATVKKPDGSVSPATVEFNFNGKTYTAKTNSNGVASVTIKFPKSYALKTTSKTKGKILTKTTTYKSEYWCDVTVRGDEYYTDTASFKVTSKKKPLVKKYKIIKKTKVRTIKVKSGIKTYKYGNYAFITYKHKSGYINYLEVAGVGKKEGYLKFFTKEHYKKKGKWKWNSWYKVPKGYSSKFSYGTAIKCDKVKVKYTQVTYKRI